MIELNWIEIGLAVSTVAGIAYGIVKHKTAQAIIKTTQRFAEQGTTYMRIKADGTFTVEEKEELADTTIAFFESIEDLTGDSIVNSASTNWLLPAKE